MSSSSDGAAAPSATPASAHLPVLALAVGGFGVGTGEFVIMGLLPDVADNLQISIPQAGHFISAYALGVAFGAPLLAVLGARLPRRSFLMALMAPTIGGVLTWSVLILGMFCVTASHLWLASVNVMLIGTVVAIGPALQIRLMDVAGDAQTLAAALNHSAFNLANALGAWLGGLTIAAGLGWTSTGWVGMILALGGLAMFWLAVTEDRRDAVANALPLA